MGVLTGGYNLKMHQIILFSRVRGEKNLHYTYLKTKKDPSTSLFCKTQIGLSRNKLRQNKSKKQFASESIRTFRIAISATGEFTSFWGDNDNSNGSNSEDALAAVVSTLNRINVIFERDLNVRLELVSDASLLYKYNFHFGIKVYQVKVQPSIDAFPLDPCAALEHANF